MRNLSIPATAAFLAVVSLAQPASAQGAASGRVGLGGMIGDPAGISLKLRTDSSFSVVFGFGFEAWGYGRAFHAAQIHADFLWDVDLRSLRRTNMSFYFGVGPQLAFASNGWNKNVDRGLWFGPRVPLGLDWEFTSRRLDLFLEWAPGFLFGDTNDAGTGSEIFFDSDASFGARYWF